MNEKGGLLVYKCRRCGKINKTTYIPEGLAMRVVASIINDKPVPMEIHGVPASKSELCMCDDGNLGVADLIGLEYDSCYVI